MHELPDQVTTSLDDTCLPLGSKHAPKTLHDRKQAAHADRPDLQQHPQATSSLLATSAHASAGTIEVLPIAAAWQLPDSADVHPYFLICLPLPAASRLTAPDAADTR